jgi:hypothetical protein
VIQSVVATDYNGNGGGVKTQRANNKNANDGHSIPETPVVRAVFIRYL